MIDERDKIIDFIMSRGEIEIALAQDKFNLKYSQAKGLIDGLVADGVLAYDSGVRYVVVKKPEASPEQEQTQTKDGQAKDEQESLRGRSFSLDEFMRKRFSHHFNSDDENYDDDNDEEDDDDKDANGGEDKAQANVSEPSRVYTETPPPHDSWNIRSLFKISVQNSFNRLVLSDKNMGRQGALKKAETWLEAVVDPSCSQLRDVYARVVFELKQMSDYAYNKYKKKLLETR